MTIRLMNDNQITQREAFEAWYGGNHDDSAHIIAQQLKDSRWEAWQAALAHHNKMLGSPEVVEAVAQEIRITDIGDSPNAHEYLDGSKKLAKAALAVVKGGESDE